MELIEIKNMTIHLPEHIHFTFMQKVRFYGLISDDILLELILKFNNGDFDELFNIPKD